MTTTTSSFFSEMKKIATSRRVLVGATATTMAAFPALYAGYIARGKSKGYFAPGIPKDRSIEDPRSPMKPVPWRMVIQHHPAARAGNHNDIRIGDPVTGQAHSWATKKELPKPGDRPIAVYQQPTHTYTYMSFEGELKKGYGRTKKGKGVKVVYDEPVRVLKAGRDLFRFDTYGDSPQKFVLTRKRGSKGRGATWYLINATRTKEKTAGDGSDSSYRRAGGALLDKDIPFVRKHPKSVKDIHSAIDGVRGDVRLPQVAYRESSFDPAGLGFKLDPGFAIPLPGMSWGKKSWRKGRLHAHKVGHLFLVHRDAYSGFPSTIGDLRHIVKDVPPALLSRVMGTEMAPVILPRRRDR